MSELDDFKYLWDGTEPGWSVYRTLDTRWTATYKFADTGPTLKEVTALRNFLDEFRNVPMNEVWKQLRGVQQYVAKQTMGNIEAHALPPQAERLGLDVTLTAKSERGSIPISPDGSALIIENNELAEQVIEKMLQAGVPVKEIHYD